MALLKSKEFHTRYFTYYLIFPDGEHWVDQTPFIHDLQFQLKQSQWRHDLKKCNDLLTKGETRWKDQNGVEHLVKIESIERPRIWGVSKNLESLGKSKSASRLARRKAQREQRKL